MPPVKKSPAFADAMARDIEVTKRKTPLWKGPSQDGITQGLLSRFLVCPERFRLLVVEGLRGVDEGFNHRLEYGNLWHACEEGESAAPNTGEWLKRLTACAKQMAQAHHSSKDQVEKWFQVAKVQFPVYVAYWKNHTDHLVKSPVFQEKVFRVLYTLPSGRTVTLRGKLDAVDYLKQPPPLGPGYYLQENKTKGNPDQQLIKRQLGFNLQTMFYLTAMYSMKDELLTKGPIRGVRYNVIRRPLSGGKGSIVQHKPSKKNPRGETFAEYYARLGEVIKETPGDFFMRLKAEVSEAEVGEFKRRFLNPILERLSDWWEHINYCHTNNKDPFEGDSGFHWQHPFGVYNVLNEGGSTDLDEHIENGSEVGLTRTDNLFPELTEE